MSDNRRSITQKLVAASMGHSDAIELLESATDMEITTQMLDTVPWIFKGNQSAHEAWREDCAKESATFKATDIYVVGSAAFGYSLSPLKPGRDFRKGLGADSSDIDIALVSESLFTAAWNDLVACDRAHSLGLYRGEMRLNVYWGLVSYRTIRPGTTPALAVRGALAVTTRTVPFRGHTAKARLYRRRLDLVAYHIQSLRALRKELKVMT